VISVNRKIRNALDKALALLFSRVEARGYFVEFIMAHPTRREVLIGGAALFAVATADTSDLTTQLNARSLPGNQGEFLMSTITTKDGTTLFYKDWGPKNAQPIMFHRGWPLSADDWDNQMMFF
jgi:non-heme chloroperoxidase